MFEQVRVMHELHNFIDITSDSERSHESGVRSQESRVRSQESKDRSREFEVKSQMSKCNTNS